MHPEVINTDSKGEKTLLEDDITFVADECPNDGKPDAEPLKCSDNTSILERTKEGTKKLILDTPMINGLSKDDSNMKLEVLKIALDPISIVKNGSSKRDNNNIEYSQHDQGDENKDANAGGKPYVCYICDKVFSRNSSLKCHIRLHLEGPSSLLRKNGSQAVNEGRSDKDEVLTRKHSDIERDDEAPLTATISNDEGPYECDQCGRLFNCKRGLYRHHGYHNKHENRLSKTEDNGSDIDLSLADENVMVSLEVDSIYSTGDFECVECGKYFKTSRAMKIHAAHAHKDTKLSHELNSIVDSENSDVENEELAFKCRHCRRLFHSKRAVSIHIAHAHKLNGSLSEENILEPSSTDEEETDELFKCKVCAKYFKSKRAMNIHAAHSHREERSVEEEEEQIEQAVSSDGEDHQFECNYCGRAFRSQRARSIHAVSAHRLNGEQLEKMKAGKSNIERENDNTDYDSLECSVCERQFNSLKTFENHTEGVCGTAQVVNGSYVYVCQQCPKTFAHPKSMSRHIRVHSVGQSEDSEDEDDTQDGEKRYQCPYCDKCYPNKQAYAGHCKVHNNRTTSEDTPSDEDDDSVDEENGYKCPLCDKIYPNKQALAGHVKVHTDRDRSLPLSLNNVTNRVSENKSTVNKVPVIEKGRIYKCKYCGRIFNASVGYAGHMKAHRAEIAADTASNSHAGTATHSSSTKRKRSEIMSDSDDENDNEKRFSCRYCNKKYASSVQLGGHVRQHIVDMKANPRSYTPVRPNIIEDKVYKCDACMQTFTYLSELKIHNANGCVRKGSSGSQNENDLLKCEYCEQTFLLRCHLQKHIKSRCHVNDLGNEPTRGLVNGDSEDVLPNKRVRKSTFLSSMYEYDPIIKIPRKSAQKSTEFHDSDDETSVLEHDHIPAESEEMNDEYYDNDIEFPASEQFVIQNANGEEEGFVFEQYDDSQGYQCNECEETYRDKLQMIIHMSFHFRNRLSNGGFKSLTIKADSTLLAPYKCDFCEECFINKKYRKRHLCKRHSDDIFKCDICEKLFLYKNTLKQHCKQHMVETKYHCEYCRKCFTSKWFLKRHTRRLCEKRLALEELTQSPPKTELVECTQTDLIVDLQPEIPYVENLDDLVKEEEIFID